MPMYIVQPGDTLSKIAKAFYNDENLWPRIHQANLALIANENQVDVGMELFIPDARTNHYRHRRQGYHPNSRSKFHG